MSWSVISKAELLELMNDGWSYRKSYGDSSGSGDDDGTYILIDENGNEVAAVMVSEETVFTATANDIREGTVAATEEGVTVGTKEIPSYIVSEGVVGILPGEDFTIPLQGNKCDYTEFQAIFCRYNTSVTDSVQSDRVSIMGSVYPVDSVDVIATIAPDLDNCLINLGLKNDSDIMYVLRYFSYKEEY